MMGKARNSSIELLRIICIFCIIFMHTIAYGGEELAFYNRYIQIVLNCFTNLGVTCFVLISGYYGVRFQLNKLIKMDLMIIFYTISLLVIRLALGEDVGMMDLLSTAFPVLSNQYWYITSYFIIVILSEYINQIPEKLSKAAFLKLLLVMLFLFSVVSTFLSFDILRSEGKNVTHMLMIYLVGRYIRKYDDREYQKRRVALLLAGNLLLTLGLETVLFVLTGRYSMFYRDCSILTVISAILLFTIFRNMYFESKIINKIATAVLAVYVFSFGFQKLVYQLIPLEEYAFSPLFFPRICIFAPCVVIGCVLIDLLRQKIFGNVEVRLADWLANVLRTGIRLGKRIGIQFTDKVKNYIILKGGI